MRVGSKKLMRALLDLTNQRFGKLLVIGFDGVCNGHRMWKCKCDCGNVTVVRQSHLRSGHTTSCGCNKNLLQHLVGQRFGYLTVKSRADDYITPRTGKRYTQWLCVCDCGKETIVLTNNLRSGSVKSCGCKSPHRLQDLSGQVFGKLTVLHMVEPYVNSKGRRLIRYECQCECGNKMYALANALRNGDVLSCGCSVMSKGELMVAKWLDDQGFTYNLHKSFDDCLSIKGYCLNFDFYLPEQRILIECNGVQHYQSIDFFGGDERLVVQQANDMLKETYAKEHQFKYLILDCRRDKLKYITGELEDFFRK